MPVTTLDRGAALVVIDLQKGILALRTAHPTADVVTKAGCLATAFRREGLLVVIVNVAGAAPGRSGISRPASPPAAGWTDLVPELNVQDGDILITKHRWNAFAETTLDRTLHERNVTQIILAGVATSMGVESTARAAHERGYNVVLVTDAMTDRNVDTDTNSIERIFPLLGERTTTADLLHFLLTAPAAKT